MDFLKKDPLITCQQETHFSFKNTYRLKVKKYKKILPINVNKEREQGNFTCIRENKF